MAKRSFKRNLKAVSPVIATIIIVAIAIVMAIAIAYWMLGLGGAFTRYEKLEIPTAYATKDESTGDFTVTMTIKNTGSAAATIDKDSTLYNGKPASAYTPKVEFDVTPDTTLEPGDEVTGTIKLKNDDNTNWTSGMSVEIKVHTVSGADYPKVIVLP